MTMTNLTSTSLRGLTTLVLLAVLTGCGGENSDGVNINPKEGLSVNNGKADSPLERSLSIDLLEQIIINEDHASFDWALTQVDGPFCEGHTCAVLTCVDNASDVRIAGEFNDWSYYDAMYRIPFRPNCFYWRADGLYFDEWVEYMLIVDWEWRLDPTNRYIRFSDEGINNAIYEPDVSRLAIIKDVYSPQLNNVRDVYVYLPAAVFYRPDARFPVLYMQDGFNVFENPMAFFGSWDVNATADLLLSLNEIEPVIIVGIGTNDRESEYLYAHIDLDDWKVEPRLDAYTEFLVSTLKPLIDESFPTKPQPEHTGIAGSSLGGISALYIAWTRSDVFGLVASLSGSFWVGEEGSGTEENPSMREIILNTPNPPRPGQLKIYLDSGDSNDNSQSYAGDGRVYTDWTRNALISVGFSNRAEWDTDDDINSPPDNFSPDATPWNVPTLYWRSIPPQEYWTWERYLRPDLSLLHMVGQGHSHNEFAWNQRFGAVLRYLYPVK